MNRIKAVSTLSVLALIVTGDVIARPPLYSPNITYVPHDKLETAVTSGAVAGGGTNELVPRDLDLGVRVSLGKKVATPPVTAAEAHTTFGHVYLIQEGEGVLVLGGELIDPKERGNGEWTGPAIKGGREFRMTKGDMITVQVGMPHWWKEVPKGVAYLAFHSFPDRNQPSARPTDRQ